MKFHTMPKNISLNKIQLPPKVAVVGNGILKNNALLATVLQTKIVRKIPTFTSIPSPITNPKYTYFLNNTGHDIQGFIGWGNKKSYQLAKRNARRQDLPVYSIEDGFIRSLDSGLDSRHALSLVIDDVGIYFDSTQASRLEQMICHRVHLNNWSEDYQKFAKRLISKIINNELSKYNGDLHCPDLSLIADDNRATHILLIDQVAGDKSIAGACIDEKTGKKQFSKMLKDVLKNHPQANIWIKAHPAGKKGYLTEIKLPKKYSQRIHVLSESVNPIALMKQVNHVYTVSSHMGFEALLLKSLGHNIDVHCYGVSWYSGWGVTDDSGMSGGKSQVGFCSARSKIKKLLEQVKQRRQLIVLDDKIKSNPKSSIEAPITKVTIEQLFFSAYLDYSHYADPASKTPCDLDMAMDWLITNRKWQHTLSGALTIYEFSRWKLPFVKEFVNFPQTELFIKPKFRWKNVLHPDHFLVNMDNPLLVWGLAKHQQVQLKLDKSVPEFHTPMHCMEDGFVRSNGLGATLLAPLSVVIDSQGIYYNATQPSDLETLLLHCSQLTDVQAERVECLQQKLLTEKVSKYNVGNALNENSAHWLKAVKSTSKNKILIVGQVEDDLSVQYCGSSIKTNADLIKRVKQNNPNAYLIYKPHPDVEAELRTGKVDIETLSLVDIVAKEVAMPDCLALIDEVHTISSLTGFEALLRGKSVTCYGLPFYAGWGLTIDIDSHIEPKKLYLKRRQPKKKLSLQQLIHCTLIDYPLYRLPNGYGLAQIEQVIDYLYSASEKVVKSEKTSKNHRNKASRKVLQHSVTQTAKRQFMRLRQQFLTKVRK